MESWLKCDQLFRVLNLGHCLLENILQLDNFHSSLLSLKKNQTKPTKKNPKLTEKNPQPRKIKTSNKTQTLCFYKKTMCNVFFLSAAFSIALKAALSNAAEASQQGLLDSSSDGWGYYSVTPGSHAML